MENKALAEQLKLGARLLELYNDNKFKIRSYESAARKLEQAEQPVAELDEDNIAQLEGIGENIAKKIRQMLETGIYDELERLMNKTPEGILELLSIKGIGPKKIATAWRELGIETPRQFLEACHEEQLSALKGFGAKTEASVKEALEYYLSHQGQVLYAQAEEECLELIDVIRNAGVVNHIEWTGSVRRKAQVLDRIDLQVIAKDSEELREFLNHCALLTNERPDDPANDQWKTAASGIPVMIHPSSKEQWARDWFVNTGSSEFVEHFNDVLDQNHENEASVFKAKDWPHVPPEMRESYWLTHPIKEANIQNLVRDENLTGCIHNHSQYSDGRNTLREMAEYCRDQGYQYFGIADHSKAAFYANGLSEERLMDQVEAVDQLNAELHPFKIFKGIEADILTDGSLDFETSVLEQLDYVVASVHAPLKMDQEKATNRLLKAVEHPKTSILGHMTGRLLLMRQGYPLDQAKVIDACAANKVVIEINANPRRLDLDWQWMDYALERGAYFSINPDAHNLEGIYDMHYGVQVARKGGVPKNRVINTYSPDEIVNFFK